MEAPSVRRKIVENGRILTCEETVNTIYRIKMPIIQTESRCMKMANRTVIKMFRCTPSEAEEIARMAAENKISESDFIRKKIFWLSPDTDELLTKLEHT